METSQLVVIKPGVVFLIQRSWYYRSHTYPMSSTNPAPMMPPPSVWRYVCKKADRTVHVVTLMERRMSPQTSATTSPSGPPSHMSSVFIDLRRANEHIEQLQFWHKVSKPKLMTAQVTWLTNLQLDQGNTCVPLIPINTNNVIAELLAELDMAHAIVKTIVPDWALFANTLI